MKYSIPSTTRTITLLAAALLIAAYVVLCLAAGQNAYRSIRSVADLDYRLQGVAKGGWTREAFSFEEKHLYSLGSSLQISFDTVRPKETGPAQIILQSNSGDQKEVQVGKDIIQSPASSPLQTISLQVTCKNPFPSAQDPGKSLCTRFGSLSITPVAGLLFPTLKTVGPLLIYFIFTLIACCLLFSQTQRTLSLIPVPIFMAALFIMHQRSIFDHWHRAEWLWICTSLLCIGGLCAKKLAIKSEATAEVSAAIPRAHIALLTAAVLFGLWLRISAVGFGLPQLYHPDESRKIGIARRIVETGNWDPNYFRHPSFMVYSTAALGTIKHAFTNSVPSVSELAVLGRSVSAVLGTATIIILFFIGRILFGNGAGLIASLFLTVAPLHVVCSRYIKEDVCMIFFSLSSLLCVLYYCFKKPRGWLFLAAGLFAGFATSVKYTGILTAAFAATPLLLYIVASLPDAIRKIPLPYDKIRSLPLFAVSFQTHLIRTLFALLLLCIGFLLITPYSILNSEKFFIDFFAEQEHMNRGHTGAISAATFFWTYHFRYSIIPALTHPVSVLACISLGFLLPLVRLPALALLLGTLLFYLPAEYVNAKPFPQPERYILPCIPFLCLALGAAQSLSSTLFKHRAAHIAIVTLLLAYPFWYSTAHRSAALYDTRQRATDWVVAHIPNGSTVVSDWYFYSPSFASGSYTVKELKRPENVKLLRELSLMRVQQEGARYFIVSSFFYQRYLAQIKRGDKTALGFQEIFSKLRPVKVYANKKYSYGFHNPTIRIYEVPPLEPQK